MRLRLGLCAVWTVGFGLLGMGCAQSTQPPGGPVPDRAPQVTAVTPDTFEIRAPFDGPIRIEFERRISERPTTGSLRDAVVISPRAGEVEVSHKGNAVEISMAGGFREETVYQVTLLPRLQDLFQNRMVDPVDLFFSTGPEFEPTLVGGVLLDRLTLQEVGDARIDAHRLPEGPMHSAVADSSGLFAFQFLPGGRYRLVAYEDQNRNREVDFSERQDAVEIEFAAGDTVVLTDLQLLQPDTTAAVLMGAEALDSLAVEVDFDDPIDPEASLAEISARLLREEGSAPAVVEVLHRWEWEEREEERLEREAEEGDDPDAPDVDDPGAVDPDAVDPDTVAVDPEALAAAADDPAQLPGQDEPRLPATQLILILESALEPGVTYTVEIEGVVNLNGVPDGGGDASFEAPEPEPEEEPGEDPDDGDSVDPDGDGEGAADPDGDRDLHPDDGDAADSDSAPDPGARAVPERVDPPAPFGVLLRVPSPHDGSGIQHDDQPE